MFICFLELIKQLYIGYPSFKAFYSIKETSLDKITILNELTDEKPLFYFSELFDWIQQSEDNRTEYIQYKNLWALCQLGIEMDSKHITRDFKKVKHQIHNTSKKFRFQNLVKYAAIIIIAIAIGYFINYIKNFSLPQEAAINEVFVPNGNRSLIILPDSSQVWLTNGSKITYPEFFTGNRRNVTLEGEGYFKVSHNFNKPFIVNLGKERIKVLGTEFSVIAYPDDNILQVDLLSGRVELDINDGSNPEKFKSYILNPQHSLVLDKTSGNLENIGLPDSFYKYWQEGIYEFEDETFANLAKKIERIFGVEVKKQTFTGAFFIDSNIYTIIETFKRASKTPFEYTINNNQIHLKRKL